MPPDASLPYCVSVTPAILLPARWRRHLACAWRAKLAYCTHTSTSGATNVPTDIFNTFVPGATFGTRTFTCTTPLSPGAAPAYAVSATTPPIVTTTGSTGHGYGAAAGNPATFGPYSTPSPVPYSVRKLPRLA